ncbi:hypothetical protein ACEPAF_9605 [Sanghuangporus sanghuang]
MANNISKTTAPLAGRPPFATDEPDSIYDNSPSAETRRLRQPKPQDNRPDSAYAVYDNYLNDKHDANHARQSGYGDIGAGLLNGDVDDDSDDETIAYHGDIRKDSNEKISLPSSLNKFPSVPIMAPKPGYAAPVSALTMPEPAATPVGHQRAQQMSPQMRQQPPGVAPISILQASSVPSTPHPLQPPMTPITPAFARPPTRQNESGVKFESESMMRCQKEDLPLARRGQKGDDFWRRFSMVVREEGSRKSSSSWLEKTQAATTNMSRMIWIVGILLLIVIGGAIGFGIYISHNSNESTRATALGGSDGQGADLSVLPTTTAAAVSTTSGVRPTLTVDKRFAIPWPTPEPTPGVMHVVHAHVSSHHVADSSSVSNSSTKLKRYRRASKRRLL